MADETEINMWTAKRTLQYQCILRKSVQKKAPQHSICRYVPIYSWMHFREFDVESKMNVLLSPELYVFFRNVMSLKLACT